MAKIVLNVPDISCAHCERTITNALTPVAGVRSVAVDIPEKRVRVDYDEKTVDVDRMKSVLADEDYPVASVSEAAEKPSTGSTCACCNAEAQS